MTSKPKQRRGQSFAGTGAGSALPAHDVPAPQPQPFWKNASITFTVALILRLIHLWQIHPTPFFDVLMGDAKAYDEWGQRIAAGDWMGHDVFYQAPLYPYFLGTLYTIAGRSLMLVRVCQALMGSLACVLLGLAGRRLFNPRAGLIAGLALAVYAPAIFFDSLLQKTALDEFFVCLMILIAAGLMQDRTRLRSWFWLGLVAGGLSLTRENALVFVVVIAGWALVGRQIGSLIAARNDAATPFPVEPSKASTVRRRTARVASASLLDLRPTALFVLGLALALSPVVIRNNIVSGGFYLTTSQFGPNFFMGNNEHADGTAMSLRVGRGSPEYERQDAIDIAERARGRTLTPSEVSSYWTEQSVTFMKAQPLAWTALQLRKAVLLVNHTEILDTESQESYAESSLVLRIGGIFGHFGILIPLALFGVIVLWPERGRLWPLAALLLAYAASVVMFYIYARYRYPLVPMLILLAAAGIDRLPDFARRVAGPQRAMVVAAVVIAAVFTNWSMVSADMNRAVTEHNLGAELQGAGRLDDALDRYRRAVAITPDYAPAYSNIGTVLQAQGKLDEAIAAYQQALKLRPDFPEVEYNLGNALLKADRPADAAAHFERAGKSLASSADVHNNLGAALADQGNVAGAITEFQKAIQLDPKSSQAHRNLGNLLAAAGRNDDALQELQQAAALNPQDGSALYDLGSLLLQLNTIPEAVQALTAASVLLPNDAAVHNNLGIALGASGRFPEAIAQFQTALQLKPGFVDARQNLQMTVDATKQAAAPGR